MTPRDKAAEVAKANEIVMTMLDAFPDGGAAYEWEHWMLAARAAINRCQQLNGKDAQRLQLVTAGQWLGEAADRIEDDVKVNGDPEAVAPVVKYLRTLGGWLADGTPGDEPKP